ncbi:MAG TPA: SigE family RNA polymerase sigma factor [Actinomycetota bacterium]|nr:SigE family RNA polymerase sigma factor [Actinomycetota bacterium]
MGRVLVSVQEGTAVTEPRGELADLYVRHVPAANRLAFLLTQDRTQSEDLVHDAFVRCVGRFGHLRAHEAFDAYLRRTIVNLHTSRLRRLRVEREWLSREGGRVERAATSGLPDVAGHEDMWRRLATLPPRQRAVLVLRYYEDLSERETADALRCSVAAVKSLTARATAALREGIRGEDA